MRASHRALSPSAVWTSLPLSTISLNTQKTTPFYLWWSNCIMLIQVASLFYMTKGGSHMFLCFFIGKCSQTISSVEMEVHTRLLMIVRARGTLKHDLDS